MENTNLMTAEEFCSSELWEFGEVARKPYTFAQAYAAYRLQFERENNKIPNTGEEINDFINKSEARRTFQGTPCFAQERLAFDSAVRETLSRLRNIILSEREQQQNSWMPTEEEWKRFPEAKWAAMDSDGDVWMYIDDPVLHKISWIGKWIPESSKCIEPCNLNWKKCKVQRPEGI
jgi:hypothetical protein